MNMKLLLCSLLLCLGALTADSQTVLWFWNIGATQYFGNASSLTNTNGVAFGGQTAALGPEAYAPANTFPTNSYAGISNAVQFVIGTNGAALPIASVTSPSAIVTNGTTASITHSNNLAVDAAHQFSGSGAGMSNMVSVCFQGSTGGQTIAASATAYQPASGVFTNIVSSSASGKTRNVLTRPMVLKNLYVVASAAAGSGHTFTLSICTNGTACNVMATMNNTATGNDTSDISPALPAGTEVEMKIVTSSSATSAAFEWGFEGVAVGSP
jgi:hypothetical protein